MKYLLITLLLTLTTINLKPTTNKLCFDYSKYESFQTAEKIRKHYRIDSAIIYNSVNYAKYYGNAFDIDYKIILSIAIRESRLNRFAVSNVGAKGVGQFTQIAIKHHNFNSDSIQYLSYGFYCIAYRLNYVKYKGISTIKLVAMYGNCKRKNVSDSILANKYYYKEFLTIYDRIN